MKAIKAYIKTTICLGWDPDHVCETFGAPLRYPRCYDSVNLPAQPCNLYDSLTFSQLLIVI